MTEVLSPSLSWRPKDRATIRLGKTIPGAIMSLPDILSGGAWRLEKAALTVFSSLMTEAGLGRLTRKKRKLVLNFFDQAMYYNRLDPLITRARHGRQSLRFIEEFWSLPQHMQELQEQALKADYSPLAANKMENWFFLNRALNYYSHEFSIGKSIPGKIPDFLPPETTRREKVIWKNCQKAFYNWQEDGRNPVEMAILFRSLSSVGLARTIYNLASETPLNRAGREANIRRLSSMTMIAQLFDDVATPGRDKMFKILGMIASALSGSSRLEGITLQVSPEDAQTAAHITRQVFGACLEQVRIEPGRPDKKALAQLGLSALGILSFLVMHREYGGSIFPRAFPFRAYNPLPKPMSKEGSAGEKNYFSATTQALDTAFELSS